MSILLSPLIIIPVAMFCSSQFQSKHKTPLHLKLFSIHTLTNTNFKSILELVKPTNAIFFSRNTIKKLALPTTVNFMI
jgi:hypothetical protein